MQLREQIIRGVPESKVRAQIRNRNSQTARNLKIAISCRVGLDELLPEFKPLENVYTRALHQLQPFFQSYHSNYRFAQENIYYDCKANSNMHFKMLFQLAQLFQHLRLPHFSCFPLCRLWIPSYGTINTEILLQKIIRER